MGVRIRPFRPSDRELIHRCLAELHEHHVRIDTRRHLVRIPRSDRRYSTRMLQRFRENHAFLLIAERDGVPAGFVAAWVHKSSKLGTVILRPKRRGHISELVVLRKHRNMGVGTQLLRAAELRLQKDGCDLIGLDVGSSSSGARHL